MTTDPHPNPHPNRWHDQGATDRTDTDVTRAFWGEGAGWASHPTDTAEPGRGRHAPRRDRCNRRTVVEFHDLRAARGHAHTRPGDFAVITR